MRISAADFLPDKLSLRSLRSAAANCEGCELFRQATQVVFGRGSPSARLMVVGETPGDAEDHAGEPFVGPAGKLLDELLGAAEISRDDIYLTNAVKHFKWTASGTRRLHAKPTAREVGACRPWLGAEIEAIQPQLILCLGATAAQTLLGREFRITAHLGQLIDSEFAVQGIIATYHPAAILRTPDVESRHQMRADVVRHLHRAGRLTGLI